ncbi:MAG: pseudouridine synthase [Bacteroidetes bacterium]|jgi:23S rRNA pseudouridine2605 synthase|nr:pseudouridine synthase [Bacteroidota bacterium]
MAANNPHTSSDAEGIRLNKYIAKAGVTSRRKADDLIDAGRVRVNGEVTEAYWYRVMPGDTVEVSGKTISPQSHRYILLNKPKDTISTTDDEKGRDTVMDLVNLPADIRDGLFPVGRLDRDTVGVLLLTNDGDLAHRLMHPRYETQKLYRVRTRKTIDPHEIDHLRRGVTLEDGRASADRVTYIDPKRRQEIGLMLHEGRNRQIRRMMEALGHEVVALERVNYAGLTSDGLERGQWRHLQGHEIKRLKNHVKLK